MFVPYSFRFNGRLGNTGDSCDVGIDLSKMLRLERPVDLGRMWSIHFWTWDGFIPVRRSGELVCCWRMLANQSPENIQPSENENIQSPDAVIFLLS